MVTWSEFAAEAPHVAAIFRRRHRATGNLCLLATLRSDGYPRISPLEPRIVEDHLVLVGMPGTHKFRDLGRDPRFNLHLRQDLVVSAAVVRKPSANGDIHALELFDAAGEVIVQFFGTRLPREGERPEWRELVTGLVG